jgi:transcriptional regulator with XRE-family HTH domain
VPPRDKLLHAFGDAVRARRSELGLSQEALALEVGLHRTYIGGIERGERNVALVNIFRLANTLEMPAADLISATQDHL